MSSKQLPAHLAQALTDHGEPMRPHRIYAQRRNASAIRIERLLDELDGVALCDGCITDRLQLTDDAYTNVATRKLTALDGFERDKALCSGCKKVKLVARRLPDTPAATSASR